MSLQRRLFILSIFAVLYLSSNGLAATQLPGYLNSTGIRDLGHYFIPPLELMLGENQARYLWWLGTLPLELCYIIIVFVVLCRGKGARLGFCLYSIYFLHWVFFHMSTLPPPDHSVWQFPEGIFTLSTPKQNDFWFSGHVANSFLLALATSHARVWLKILSWSLFAFEVFLVLSARTHYSIDVLGALFVAYTVNVISMSPPLRSFLNPQAST